MLHAATEAGPAPAESAAAGMSSFTIGPSTRLAPHDSLVVDRADLVRSDSLFARIASIDGERAARDSLGTKDLRLLRSASDRERSAAVSIEPVGSRLAESADLGYTFGTCTVAASQPVEKNGSGLGTVQAERLVFGYVHVWRRDAAGRRRLALDLRIPAPHE